MADLSHITELVGAAPLSDEEKKKILALAEKEGEAAALAALDEKAADAIKTSVEAYQEGSAQIDEAVASLADEFGTVERKLEQELIEALKKLPEGSSKERDQAWEAYYSKYDEARAFHDEKVRAAMARLVGGAGAQ
jgi:hypothetical protein